MADVGVASYRPPGIGVTGAEESLDLDDRGTNPVEHQTGGGRRGCRRRDRGCEGPSASSVGRPGWAATHVTPSRTKAMPRATARPGGPARLIAVAGARLLDQA